MAIILTTDMSLLTHFAQLGIRPKRYRGQNFLIDKNILRKIVDAAAIRSSETIVEIGAGTGVLTQELASRASQVIAVELDKALIPLLERAVTAHKNVAIIQDDCLDVPSKRYGEKDGSYAVVANIPYNITSRLIRKFLEEYPRPSRMIILIQHDVAERMRAKQPNMNVLALAVQYYADVKVLFSVSRHCFFPKPKIESAVVEIIPKNPSMLNQSKSTKALQERFFFKLIGAAFKGKRKKLTGTLSHATGIPKKDIENLLIRLQCSVSSRPQELSLEQWIMLTDAIMLSPLPQE